jgi:hypothetical protein
MAVGNQATVPGINQALTNLAVQLRSICEQVTDFQTFVVAVGTAGLEAIGFDSTDAANVLTQASYLNTIAEIYYGTFGQGAAGSTATAFDFNNELSQLWAGQ